MYIVNIRENKATLGKTWFESRKYPRYPRSNVLFDYQVGKPLNLVSCRRGTVIYLRSPSACELPDPKGSASSQPKIASTGCANNNTNRGQTIRHDDGDDYRNDIPSAAMRNLRRISPPRSPRHNHRSPAGLCCPAPTRDPDPNHGSFMLESFVSRGSHILHAT